MPSVTPNTVHKLRQVWGAALATLCLAVGSGSAQMSQTGLPEQILTEMASSEPLPTGNYAEALELEAEDKTFSHQMGRAVSDSKASGKKAWGADVDEDKPGVLLYGPYVEIGAGDYVAFFRLRMAGQAGDYIVARLDVCTSDGKVMLTARDVLHSELAGSSYVQLPLHFHHPGGRVEFRVMLNGSTSLAIDKVSVFRLENGKPAAAASANRVPLAIPSGVPRDLAHQPQSRPFGELFPRSKEPDSNLVVIDISKEPRDWQLALRTLQGIVNREKPRIYLIGNDQDRQWLDWMIKRGWVKSTEAAADARQLISRFRGSLKGVVVYDPGLPPTVNVATMMTGLEDALAVSPRLAEKLSLPVVSDLRGRWKTGVEAYRWALDTLWPHMNHDVLACLWPGSHELRDYLVQHRIFIFWIPGSIDGARQYSRPDDEMRLAEELLSGTPPNTPIMGYSWAGPDLGIGEGGGVTLFSEFAKFLVGSVQSSNLSVHSGIRVDQFRQRLRPAPEIQKSRVYVCFTMSDGDNLPVMTVSNWPQLWKDRTRGELPVGWTISPASWMLVPAVMDYYYSTATPNDTFMAAVSGVGYCYPDSYAKRFREQDRLNVFDGFLSLTDAHMRKMDLRAVCPSLGGTAIRRYAEQVRRADSVFPDYGRTVTRYEDATFMTERGIPVFRAATTWDQNASRQEAVRSLASQIRDMAGSNRPAFLHVFICNWFWDLPAMKQVLERLGPGFVAVGPDELAALYKSYTELEQVQIRKPHSAAYIEGQTVRLNAYLRNTSKRTFEARAAVSGGLKNARVTPEQVRVRPGQEVDLEVTGRPNGDEIVLDISGPFGVKSVRSALRRVKTEEWVGEPPDTTLLTSTALYEGESLNHQSGTAVKDSGASDGAAWASPEKSKQAGHIVFGPYSSLPPGRYLAAFRIKRTGEGTGTAAHIDTCAGGAVTITSSRNLLCEELPLGDYRAFPLEFDHPGGSVETRVFWTGAAPISVDHIALWALPRRPGS